MERLNDIKQFINDVYNNRDVTYTKEMREETLCFISGVRYANRIYIEQITRFVFDMTVGDPKDALKALQRKEQLAKDIEDAFGEAGISRHLDPDSLVKGVDRKNHMLIRTDAMFRDTYNKLIAMPEEGTYLGSKESKAEPKTDGKDKERGYTVERVYNTDKDFPILRGN